MIIIVPMKTELPFNCKPANVLGIDLLIPVEEEVRLHYIQQQLHGNSIPFPYWTRLWASAVALATYIEKYTSIVTGKDVLEIGAGLGLPSFITAKYAHSVVISDYLPETISLANENIERLKLINATAKIIDWRILNEALPANVLLLSDVNYDPASSWPLKRLVETFLQQDENVVLLSTPQRLSGKNFVQEIEPFITHSENHSIYINGITTSIAVFKLSGNRN